VLVLPAVRPAAGQVRLIGRTFSSGADVGGRS
jgi:hypothetical protein